jgi:hypothetical protein
MSARNLHRLAGARHRQRLDALDGPCGVCIHGRGIPHDQAPPSVGFIEDWTGRPMGVCQAHADAAPAHGRTVYTRKDIT